MMQVNVTTMEKLDKNSIQNPQEWIQENIVNSSQAQMWRQNYLAKLGIKQNKTQSLDLEVEQSFSNSTFSLNFLGRTNDDVRLNYIQKLQRNKVMQKSKANQTCTPSKLVQVSIFDWDDTLLCTTYLGGYGFIDLPQDVWDQLGSLNESASRVLEIAASHGDVFIITNAAQGWVEYSSKLYMNKVFQVIFDKKIVVISARAGYEDLFPGDCGKWKIEAFKDIRARFDCEVFTNLICLGDSNIEIDAAHVLAKEFNIALIKTIKFRECPKPDELVKQQDLVSDKFETIYSTFKNLTIRLEKKTSNQ